MPSFEELVRQIKYDVGSYLFRHQDDKTLPAPPGDDPSPEEITAYKAALQNPQYRKPTPGERCAGQIDFAIAKVKIVVTTTVETKQAGSASLKIPLNLVTISPSASAASSLNNTLTTTLEIYPINDHLDQEPPSVPRFKGRPITDTLETLRSDLIKTADTSPCFNFGENTDGKTNSVKWGFTVVRSRTDGVKFELLVFSLGAEGSSTRTAANTIEVFFIPSGEGFG